MICYKPGYTPPVKCCSSTISTVVAPKQLLTMHKCLYRFHIRIFCEFQEKMHCTQAHVIKSGNQTFSFDNEFMDGDPCCRISGINFLLKQERCFHFLPPLIASRQICNIVFPFAGPSVFLARNDDYRISVFSLCELMRCLLHSSYPGRHAMTSLPVLIYRKRVSFCLISANSTLQNDIYLLS